MSNAETLWTGARRGERLYKTLDDRLRDAMQLSIIREQLGCHPERSEGSHNRSLHYSEARERATSLCEIPHFVRDDSGKAR